MAYNEGRTDLNLRLFDGSIHQYRPSDPLSFQLTYYRVNDIRVKDVYDELVRNSSETVRGDREMSTCEMLSVIGDARTDERNAVRDREGLLRSDLRVLLHLPALPSSLPDTLAPRLPTYCRWLDRVQGAFSKTAEPPPAAQPPGHQVAQQGATVTPQELPPAYQQPALPARAQQPGVPVAAQQPVAKQPGAQQPGPPPAAQRPGAHPPGPLPAKRLPPSTQPPSKFPVGKPAPPGSALRQGPGPVPLQARPPGRPSQRPGLAVPRTPPAFPNPLIVRPQLSNWAQVATATDRETEADRRADRFSVEVHKKYSISFACISFVIIGIVLALRFPRGGIGLVIGGGLLLFSIHYIGLTAGESLADRGLVSPWEAMWAPNIFLTVIGVIGLFHVSRESGSTRGGDFQEILDGVRHLFRRLRRRGAAPAEGM
jgi:lipopolysaccharide export system permease protein